MKILMIFSLLVILYLKFSYSEPDANKFIVWGPGLNVKIALPVRYFFVQAVDSEGGNITQSLGKDAIELHISISDQSHLRIQREVLDRHDGSYLVRFRPHATYKDLSLIIRYNGELVADSPYYLQGHVYDEDCDCGLEDLDEFIRVYGCPQSYEQVTEDFKNFPAIDMVEAWADMRVRFDRPRQMSVCHYVIKDNQLYRKTLGEYVGFKMFSDALLTSLLKKVKMPDLDFVWNFGDWPLVKGVKLPLISWCGSTDSLDLVVPTYEMTSSTLDAVYRTDRDMLSMQHKRNANWSSKHMKAFWRGRDSSQERLDLVQLGKQHPDLIDAQLTHVFFFKDQNLSTHPVVPFFSFFDYAYQLSLDGTVAGYRFPYLLAGGSLVFKQESKYYEHFYRELIPYQHYIPLKRDLSDLIEKLEWAKSNDFEARRISENAYKFTVDNLSPVSLYCYHAVFFRTYAARLRSVVEVEEGMEHVKRESRCDCHGGRAHVEL